MQGYTFNKTGSGLRTSGAFRDIPDYIRYGVLINENIRRGMEGKPMGAIENYVKAEEYGVPWEGRKPFTLKDTLSAEDKKKLEIASKQQTKALYGWTKDENGHYVKKTPEQMNIHRATLERMGETPSKLPEGISKAVSSGVRQGAEGAITRNAWDNPIEGVPYAASQWLESKGFKDLAGYAKQPGMFWGAIGAGVIGIPLLVSAFLGKGSQQQKPVVVNVNTGAQQPMQTTSFWRS